MKTGTPLPTDEREKTLPVWAKALLKATRAEVSTRDTIIAEQGTALALATGQGAEDSDVFVDEIDANSMEPRVVRLGRGTEVRFVPRSGSASEGNRWVSARVSEDGRLVVDCGDRLVVLPRHANSIELRVDKP